MYWKGPIRINLIADTMSRNRFKKLKSLLHFSDNSKCQPKDSPDYDKLFKIRPLIDRIRNLLKIEVEECHVVDETIIPFKGKSFLKKYMKNKPHK